MCCVCMSFIVGRGAANLPEDARDSAELVAESPCQRAARAGLCQLLAKGCSWGLRMLQSALYACKWTLTAQSVCSQRLTRACRWKPCAWPPAASCLQMDPNCPEQTQSETHKGLPLETL